MVAKIEAMDAKIDSLKTMFEQFLLQRQPTSEPIVTNDRPEPASGSTNISRDHYEQDSTAFRNHRINEGDNQGD